MQTIVTPTDTELAVRAREIAEARYSIALSDPELVHMGRIQSAACERATLRHLKDIRLMYPMLKAYRHAMSLIDANDFTVIDEMIDNYGRLLGLLPS